MAAWLLPLLHDVSDTSATSQLHRALAILQLGTFFLAADDDAGWNVAQTHSRFDLVHVLAALAARRNVSISMSAGLTSISIVSSISG